MTFTSVQVSRALRDLALVLALALCLAIPLSAQTAATTNALGSGCGPSDILIPTLQSARPVLGTSVSLSTTNFSSGGVAYMLYSLPIPTPIPFTNSCMVYVDPGLFLTDGPFQPDPSGAIQAQMLLSAGPELAGLNVTVQAVNFTAVDASSFEVTNALTWVLGTF